MSTTACFTIKNGNRKSTITSHDSKGGISITNAYIRLQAHRNAVNAYEPGEEPDLNPGEPQEEIGNGESTNEDVIELKRQRQERERQQKQQQMINRQQQQQPQREQHMVDAYGQQQQQQPQVNSRRRHAFDVSLDLDQLHAFCRLRKERAFIHKHFFFCLFFFWLGGPN